MNNTILLNQIREISKIIYDVADYAADEARNNGIRESAISPLNAVGKVRISLSEAIENTEKETAKKTAITIIQGINEARDGTGHVSECNCGCPGAFVWGIMKGWGIEPEDLKPSVKANLEEKSGEQHATSEDLSLTSRNTEDSGKSADVEEPDVCCHTCGHFDSMHGDNDICYSCKLIGTVCKPVNTEDKKK